jgi:hypothetical protein
MNLRIGQDEEQEEYMDMQEFTILGLQKIIMLYLFFYVCEDIYYWTQKW